MSKGLSRRKFLKMAGVTAAATLTMKPEIVWGNPPSEGSTGDYAAGLYLSQKPYSPVASEVFEPVPLRVNGTIPEDISGSYFRNGPNPYYSNFKYHHWFDGDGMIHKIKVHQGKAYYQRRYVQTTGLEQEQQSGKRLFAGLGDVYCASFLKKSQYVLQSLRLNEHILKDTSNTDLIFFNGELVSLWWLSGTPYRLNPETLETLGRHTFHGTYDGSMGAHARIDPATNDLFFIDFGQILPTLRVHRVNSEGRLVWATPISIPYPRIYHDILFTQKYVVIPDFPLGFVNESGHLSGNLNLDRSRPSRIHLLSRETGKIEHTFEFDSTYALHIVNSFETADGVTVVACRYEDPIVSDRNNSDKIPKVGSLRVKTSYVSWKLEFATGKVTETTLDDVNTEFARMNDLSLGKSFRYWYAPVLCERPTVLFSGLIKYDLLTGRQKRISLKTNEFCEEPVFISRKTGLSTTTEDSGYVGVIVHNLAAEFSEFRLYDASSFDPYFQCSIRFPGLIPHGFHCKWQNS